MDLEMLKEIPSWEWPEGTAREVRKCLRDPRRKPGERLLAAEMAGEITVMDDDVAETLLQILENTAESEELRARAAGSFGPALELGDQEMVDGEFEDPEAVPITQDTFTKIGDALDRIYRDESAPKLVRRRVLEASVRRQASWHDAAIREAYSSGDRDWMLTAVFAMQYVRGFEAESLAALKNTDPEIVREAVLAAGSKELMPAWPYLSGLLRNPKTKKDLLLAAIEAAGNYSTEESQEILHDLSRSEDPDIADAADEALSFATLPDDFDEDEDEDEDEDAESE
jgi:hypothetical protein